MCLGMCMGSINRIWDLGIRIWELEFIKKQFINHFQFFAKQKNISENPFFQKSILPSISHLASYRFHHNYPRTNPRIAPADDTDYRRKYISITMNNL